MFMKSITIIFKNEGNIVFIELLEYKRRVDCVWVS